MSEIKIGDKIRIINMIDEPDYAGREGTVELVDGAGQLHGTWGSLAIIPEEDEFEIISSDLDEALYGKEEINEFFILCDKLGLKTFGDLLRFADDNKNRIIVNDLLSKYDSSMSTDAFFETLRDYKKEHPDSDEDFEYDDPLNVIKKLKRKDESMNLKEERKTITIKKEIERKWYIVNELDGRYVTNTRDIILEYDLDEAVSFDTRSHAEYKIDVMKRSREWEFFEPELELKAIYIDTEISSTEDLDESVETKSSDKEQLLKTMAYEDVETDQVFDRDDFEVFKGLMADQGYEITRADLDTYYKYVEEATGNTINEDNEDKTCVICGKTYTGYGNNAQPVADGRCCDDCNLKKVIPARIKQMKDLKEDNNQEYELDAIVKDSINHLVNDLGKDSYAEDFADDVVADIEDNYDIDVPEDFNKYQDWVSQIMQEVSRQLNTNLDEGMKGQYVVLGVTDNGERKYYNADLRDWFDTAEQGTIFTDLDIARDSWSFVTKNGYELPYGFRRVFVPIYNSDMKNKASTVDLQEERKTITIKKEVERKWYIENSLDGRYVSTTWNIGLDFDFDKAKSFDTRAKAMDAIEDMKESREWKYFDTKPRFRVFHVDTEISSSEDAVNESIKLKESVEEKWNIGSNKLVQVGSPEYLNLVELAQKLEDNSPNDYKYEVEKTYEDFGANMQWYTIICYDHKGDHWQVLSTKDWLDLANTSDINTVYNQVISNKYFQDKKRSVDDMNFGDVFKYLD